MILKLVLLLLAATPVFADELEPCFEFSSPDRAIAACTAIIDRQPPAYAATRFLALEARSELWWRHHLDHRRAIADATAAICAWPVDPPSWRWRAKLFEEAGEPDRAAEDRAAAESSAAQVLRRKLECGPS